MEDLEEQLTASGVLSETLSHYDGEVQLHYHAPLHVYYTVDEDGVKRLVPGSTTVCGTLDKSGPLTQWAANKTVEFIIENFPRVGSRTELMENFQEFRNKAPWSDYKDINAGLASCTTYELAKLLNEARFNFRSIKEKAGNIGHIAHEWLEGYVKAFINTASHDTFVEAAYGRPMPLFDPRLTEHPHEDLVKATNSIMVALKWFGRHGFNPIFSEKKVYSREFGYAGTLDWLAYITSCGDYDCCPFDGEALVLGDFKTSNSLYDEYRMQLASYRHAIEEEYPQYQIGAIQILRLGKEDGDFEVMPVSKECFEGDLDGFLGLLQAYHWRKQIDFDRRYEKDAEKAEKNAAKDAEKAAKALAKAEKVRLKAEKDALSPPKKRKPVKRAAVRCVSDDIGIEIEDASVPVINKPVVAERIGIEVEAA